MKIVIFFTLLLIGWNCNAEILSSRDIDDMELSNTFISFSCENRSFHWEVVPKSTATRNSVSKRFPPTGEQEFTCLIEDKIYQIKTSFYPSQPTNNQCAGADGVSVIFSSWVVDYCRHLGVSSIHLDYELRICGIVQTEFKDNAFDRKIYGCIDYGTPVEALGNHAEFLKAVSEDWR